MLALGFKPEPFRDAFPDGRHGDVRVHYAVEPEPLDTAGAIAFAAREVGRRRDVRRRQRRHHHRPRRGRGSSTPTVRPARTATIHLTPVADPSAFGVVETDADGVVRRFVEKPAPGETESNLINAGTYVLEPSVLDLIEPGMKVSIERDTFPRLVARGGWLRSPPTTTGSTPAGPALYLRANLDLVTGRVGGGDEPAIAPTATVDPTATLHRQRRRRPALSSPPARR